MLARLEFTHMACDELHRPVGRGCPHTGVTHVLVNWRALIAAHQMHQDRNNSKARMDLDVLFRGLAFPQAEYVCLMESQIVCLTHELAHMTCKEEFRRNKFV